MPTQAQRDRLSDFARKLLRECDIRNGNFVPATPDERRQAKAGPCDPLRLDVLEGRAA